MRRISFLGSPDASSTKLVFLITLRMLKEAFVLDALELVEVPLEVVAPPDPPVLVLL